MNTIVDIQTLSLLAFKSFRAGVKIKIMNKLILLVFIFNFTNFFSQNKQTKDDVYEMISYWNNSHYCNCQFVHIYLNSDSVYLENKSIIEEILMKKFNYNFDTSKITGFNENDVFQLENYVRMNYIKN